MTCYPALSGYSDGYTNFKSSDPRTRVGQCIRRSTYNQLEKMLATTVPQHVQKENGALDIPPPPSPPVDDVPERVDTPPPPPSTPPPPPPISDDETSEPPPLPPPPPAPIPIVGSSVNHETGEKSKKRLKTPVVRPPRWGSRDVSVFDIIEQVGEGTYGYVGS